MNRTAKNRTTTSILVGLTIAAVMVPVAQARVADGSAPPPTTASTSTGAAVGACAAGALPHGSCWVNTNPSSTVRSDAPIARVDGPLSGASVPVTATGMPQPPDRIDASSAATLAVAAATVPPDRIDAAQAATARPIVIDGGGDFDWSAAGIGFGVAAGLALLGAGSVMTVRWRRHTGPLAH